MLGWGRRREGLLEEVEEHIALETAENVAAGMSPDAARRAARKRFGNGLLAAEGARTVWGWVWLERMVQDVRYAARQLRRDPGFFVTAVVVLALGLFASTAIYAFVDAALVSLCRIVRRIGWWRCMSVSRWGIDITCRIAITWSGRGETVSSAR